MKNENISTESIFGPMHRREDAIRMTYFRNAARTIIGVTLAVALAVFVLAFILGCAYTARHAVLTHQDGRYAIDNVTLKAQVTALQKENLALRVSNLEADRAHTN